MTQRPIRIALIIDLMDHSMGGTERQLVHLARGLDRARFLPYLVCLRPTGWQEENREALRVFTFDATRFASPRTYLDMMRLVRFLVREKIDIVQTHFKDGNTVGTLCGSLAGCRAIVSTRRGIPYSRGGVGRLFLRCLDSLAAGFIANSRWAARMLAEGERVPQAKIRIIHNGIANPPAQPPGALERSRTLEGHSLDPAHAHVVAVGNLRRVKRHDVLIRSVARVVGQYPLVRFLVVGDGPLRDELTALAGAEGVSHAVRFLGRQADVFPLLRACDIGLLCSDSESQSNAIIEYMAAGLPVICTNVGGNPELVADASNGFLVPAADSDAVAERTLQLLTDRALAARMGAESRRIAGEAFSLEAMIAHTSAYYEELMARGRRS
jgi:L-malate glycosyltransferase